MKQLRPSEVKSVCDQIARKQNNKCAVCNKPFTQRDGPVLDHCHITGYIRGVLHNSCNRVEGRVKAKAHLCHKGISATEYIIGLGKYLTDTKIPKYNLIHPSHMTPEAKRLQRNKKARESRLRNKNRK